MAVSKPPIRKPAVKEIDPAQAFWEAANLAAVRFAPLLKALERY